LFDFTIDLVKQRDSMDSAQLEHIKNQFIYVVSQREQENFSLKMSIIVINQLLNNNIN